MKHYKCSIFAIEDLNIKSSDKDRGKKFNRLCNSNWCRTKLVNNLNKWCNIYNVQFIQVKPDYSSFVGNLVYRHLRLPDMILSSIEISRRGYEFYHQYILKDKCINLNDGGTGSFTYLNNLYTREERSQIILSTSTSEQRHERAVIGGNANKKRLENKEALEDFRQKMIQVHANMSEEEKKDRYDKVSKSLKEYYQSKKGQEELKQRNLKNKETNQKVARQWREKFKEIFNGKQPESFRKYGKQKESYQLFKEIKNLPKEEQKIRVDNFFQSLNN